MNSFSEQSESSQTHKPKPLPPVSNEAVVADVLRLTELDTQSLSLLSRFLLNQGLVMVWVDEGVDVPGSHWGEEEAGLIGNRIYCRNDTPTHSLLHEACHFFLMDKQRQANLHTDAGGTAVEENAVCYLQIRLADQLHGLGAERMFADMDRWGYSFRLGSTQAWFERDAEDAVEFLKNGGFWEHFKL